MATKRRGKGEGSIHYREKESRWVATIRLPNGTRKVRYGRTRSEAVEALRELEREREEGIFARDRRLTVDGLFDLWLRDVVSIGRRVSTQEDYRLGLKRLRPALGDIKLVDVKPQQVQAVISALAKTHAPLVVRKTHIMARMAFDQAIEWGMISKNPSSGVRLPRVEAREMRVLEREELMRLLISLREHELFPLFELLALTGLRKGEALALTWDDIGEQEITVRRTLTRDQSLGPPKSASGRRTISVPAVVMADLKRHRLRQREHQLAHPQFRNTLNLVFAGKMGAPLAQSTPNRALTLHLEAMGFPHIRVHDLRHTLATLLMADGVFPNKVQRHLGHSNVAITMGAYGHVTPAMRGQVAEDIERLLGNDLTDSTKEA